MKYDKHLVKTILFWRIGAHGVLRFISTLDSKAKYFMVWMKNPKPRVLFWLALPHKNTAS